MKFPYLKEATRNLFSKPSTVEYPFKVKESPAKPNYRGRISYDPEKCVNCGTCIKVCCPQAITVTTEDVEGGQNITYEFDLKSCTFCATCQDFCEEGAIVLTEDYHMVDTDPAKLVVRGTRFKEKTDDVLGCNGDCIYCTICARNCPHGALTVDRAAKVWDVDYEKCVQCGICVGKCPKKALSFMPKEQAEQFKADKEKAKADEAAAKAEAPAENTAEEAGAVSDTAEQKLTCSEDCIFCTLCARNCPQEAITVDRAAKTWEVDHEKCIKCGLCVEKCPKKALSFK